jgi:hypothetical protein
MGSAKRERGDVARGESLFLSVRFVLYNREVL